MEEITTLTECNVGDELTIDRIETDDETARFLTTMGFYHGSVITVMSVKKGSYSVTVLDSRVALDSNLSSSIYGYRKVNDIIIEKPKSKVLSLFKREKRGN